MTVVLEAQTLRELLTAWELRPPVRLTLIVPGGTTSDVWRVDAANGVFAAKLVHDEPRFVEPGLRVAAAVAAGGVPTGGPVPTTAGAVAVHVPVGRSRFFTLALLDWCDGQPLDFADPATASRGGDVLGRVHAALAAADPRPEVPGQLLGWFDGFLACSDDARESLRRVQAMVSRGLLTMGIVYGDPSPEVLVLATGELAVIDWGTPSLGPLLHDVCVWASAFAPAVAARGAFLTSYRRHAALGEHEYEHIDDFSPLLRSLVPPSSAREEVGADPVV
jgi:Ser/Thr protein kinase RdoA (MazF antagonist)